MGTGKDEISKEDEALDSARQMFEDAEAEVEEDETFEAMNNMFEQAEKEAAKKAEQDEDDANLEAVANMFEQADEEAAAKEAADEAEKNAATKDADTDEKQAATNDNSPVPKPAADDDKKKKHKDPMMELVEELNSFVASVNDAITDFVKDKGKEAWDKLNDTGPMKTLNGAMNELSQFAKDKVGEQVDKIADSKEVNDAKDFVKGLQDTVNGAFSKLMNMAANAVADAVKGITAGDTPSAKMDTPTDSVTSTTDEPMKALSDSMGDMDAQSKSKAPEVDADLEEDLSSGLKAS